MSVVGFDIGNFKSSVGVARQGGIDIVANEYSDRITPTYVSFTNNERFQGHSAKQQEITNHQNTISSFKRLLARKFTDPQVANERSYQPVRISPDSEQRIQYNVDYLNETKSFTGEQIMAMFLTKLKTIAEMNLTTTKVTDCVISVPSYMTDTERRALLDSAQVAGLNCLKLMNETSAVALTYGLYHSNLPDVNEKPHVVVFVDMGYTSLQASAVAFNKGKLKILATTFDQNLGGRDFDRVLMDYFQGDFKQRYKIDAYTNARARLRLRAECEKLKKLMSSNSSVIPLNIECFMNDVDVTGKMKREDFEKLSESLMQRVRNVLSDLLKEANLTPQDIDLVEIVGGSTRVPAVKQIVQDVFQKEASTTLNADEACARGCTLMCAILSPNFKVKEFKIEDCQLFPITLSWKGVETDDNELEVFPKFDKIPMSKLLTVYKREPFEIEACYRFPNNIPFNEPRIGKFFIGNVTPNAQGENSEVKLKARITKNGIFEISSPQLIETIEVPVNTTQQQQQQQDQQTTQLQSQNSADEQQSTPQKNGGQDQQTAQNGSNGTTNEMDGVTSDEVQMHEEQSNQSMEASGSGQQPQQQVIKKKKTKTIDLPLTPKVPQLSKNEINFFIEQELQMIQQDKKEKERSEAKNSVEEYIYEAREKLSNEYEKYIHEDNKNAFLKLLDETESWLYSEEADNQEKNVYVDRLQKLKSLVTRLAASNQVKNLNINNEIDKLSKETANLILGIAPPLSPSAAIASTSAASAAKTNKPSPTAVAAAAIAGSTQKQLPPQPTLQQSQQSQFKSTSNINQSQHQYRQQQQQQQQHNILPQQYTVINPLVNRPINTKPPPPTLLTSNLSSVNNLGAKSTAAIHNIMNQSMMINTPSYRATPYVQQQQQKKTQSALQHSGSGHQFSVSQQQQQQQQQRYSSNTSLLDSSNNDNNNHNRATVTMPLSKVIKPSQTPTPITLSSSSNRRSMIGAADLNASLRQSSASNTSPIKIYRNSSVPPTNSSNNNSASSSVAARPVYHHQSNANSSLNRTLQHFYSDYQQIKQQSPQISSAAAAQSSSGSLPPLPNNHLAQQQVLNLSTRIPAASNNGTASIRYQQQLQQTSAGGSVKYVTASPLQLANAKQTLGTKETSSPNLVDFYGLNPQQTSAQQQPTTYYTTSTGYNPFEGTQLFSQPTSTRQSIQLSSSNGHATTPGPQQQSYYYLTQQQSPLVNTKYGDLKNRNSIYGGLQLQPPAAATANHPGFHY